MSEFHLTRYLASASVTLIEIIAHYEEGRKVQPTFSGELAQERIERAVCAADAARRVPRAKRRPFVRLRATVGAVLIALGTRIAPTPHPVRRRA